jgi:hypothetical protein
MGNACYYSVQNPLSSRLLSTAVTIKYVKQYLCLQFCICADTWPLTLRKDHRSRVKIGCQGEYEYFE